MTDTTPMHLRVFLCHSSGDKAMVRSLYQRLQREMWVDPWLDEEKLLPGQNWRDEIEQAVEQSHIILVCLSLASITKEGYVQREIRVALDHADYMPEGTAYIVPVKLEECAIPRRLRQWQWVNYYQEGSHERLLQALRLRAEQLGIPTPPAVPAHAAPPQILRPEVNPVPSPSPAPVAGPQPGSIPVETEQERLLREITDERTSHERRRDIGDRLQQIGDRSPGKNAPPPEIIINASHGSVAAKQIDGNIYIHNVFAGDAASNQLAQQLLQLNAEKEELQARYGDIENQVLQTDFEKIRKAINEGYIEENRDALDSLILRVKFIGIDSPAAGLKGHIYRLAAFVYLPNRPWGNAITCREYLLCARKYTPDAELDKCQILEATLAYINQGSTASLTLVDGITTRESDRFRFGVYLEENDFPACAAILAKFDLNEILNDVDWLRALAIYYAKQGDHDNMRRIVDRLKEKGMGTTYAIAGMALAYLAYYRFGSFCKTHNICPEAHMTLGMNLRELVDERLIQEASTMFAEASRIYVRHGSKAESQQTLISAIHLARDTAQSTSSLDGLLQELARTDPTNPELLSNTIATSNPVPTVTLDQIRTMLSRQPEQLHTILDMISSANFSDSEAHSVVIELRQHETLFTTEAGLHILYLRAQLLLQMKYVSEVQILEWLQHVAAPPHYPHIPQLLAIVYLLGHNIREAAPWIDTALGQFPDHPEILAAATHFYREQQEFRTASIYIQKLFDIIKTAGTATLLMNVLYNAQKYGDILRYKADIDSLPVDIAIKQRIYGGAYLFNNQLKEALAYFEWLYTHNQAAFPDLMNLQYIYTYFERRPDAIVVLHVCIQRFANEPDGYLRLSEAYFEANQPNDAYRIARQAYALFADNDRVVAWFMHMGFQTGRETEADVQVAMRAFHPGGRFENSQVMQRIDMTDVITHIQNWNARSQELYLLYEHDQISSLMLCSIQNVPLFRFHRLRQYNGNGRYAARGDKHVDAAFLRQNMPREIVLDYTALLTLWSLYGETWISAIQPYFDHIWISSYLLDVLTWEQTRLTDNGQPSRYKSQIEVRRTKEFYSEELPIHDRIDPPGDTDITGSYTEIHIATEKKLLYLTEHTPPDDLRPPCAVGLRLIVEALYKNGALAQTLYDRLLAHAKPVPHSEKEYTDQIIAGSDLVIERETLLQIAEAAALPAFLRFFGHIHLSQPTWAQTIAEIEAYELNQRMQQELHILHTTLAQAIESGNTGFIQIEPALPELSWRRKRKLEEESDQFNIRELHFIEALLLDYSEDIIRLATAHNLPLWADDRRTQQWYSEAGHSFPFGTDTFLELKYLGNANENEYYTEYQQLIEWGYWGIPLNPGYILWLLQRGLTVDAPLLQKAILHYRQYIIDVHSIAQNKADILGQFAAALIRYYTEAVVTTMALCYTHHIAIETCRKLFGQLDLTHYSTVCEGDEPLFFAAILIDVVNRIIVHNRIAPGSDPETASSQPDSAIPAEFSYWLDTIMRDAGVAADILQEAWTRLLLSTLRLGQADTHEKTVQQTTTLVRLILAVAPAAIANDLSNGELGQIIQNQLSITAPTLITFTGRVANEEMRVSIPEDIWQTDSNLAVERFLAKGEAPPIAQGSVTLGAKWFTPGSIFYEYEILPAEIARRFGNIALNKPEYALIVPVTRNEEYTALSRQGKAKLDQHGKATDGWTTIGEEVESDVARGSDVTDKGTQLQHILLGYSSIAMDYLSEATQISPHAFLSLLPTFDPIIIKSWLGLPQLDWTGPDALTAWVENSSRLDTSTENELGPTIRDDIQRFGHSLFADAVEWQNRATRALALTSSEAAKVIFEQLYTLAQKTASSSLKANIVVCLMRYLLGRTDMEDDYSEALAGVINDIALPREAQSLQQVCIQLEHSIGSYLYSSWRDETAWENYDGHELAYLAHVGASYIVDTLHGTGSLSAEYITVCIQMLTALTQQLWLSNPKTAHQPAGLYKPARTQRLNYPLAYLVASFDDAEQTSSPLFEKILLHSRQQLLTTAVTQRCMQAAVGWDGEITNWFDAALAGDISQEIAKYLGSDELHEAAWTEDDRQSRVISSAPEAGPTLVQAMLDQIPDSPEAKIQDIIQIAFLATPNWNGAAFAWVEVLLTAPIFGAIQKFPSTYQTVILNLLQTLVLADTIPTNLSIRMREVAFGLYLPTQNLGDYLEAHSIVLERMCAHGYFGEESALWLQTVASNEAISLRDVRRTIKPFIYRFRSYSPAVKRTIAIALLAINAKPRFARVWEFTHVRRALFRDSDLQGMANAPDSVEANN